MQVYQIFTTTVVFTAMLSSVFTVSGVAAVICYSCSSSSTPNCGENFSPFGLATCVGSSCTKSYSGASGLNPSIYRSCSTDLINHCTSVDVIYQVATCSCTSNLCNSAGRLHFSSNSAKITTLFIVAMLLFFVIRMRN